MVSEREWWAWQDMPTAGGRRDDPDWDELATALPPEVAAFLGRTGEWGGPDGGDDEDDAERWPAPGDPCAALRGNHTASATYAACTPRFLAPAPLRSRSRRVRRNATRVR
ncbi:hypothetical protein [Luedemannella helvata]|uniref:Uncharacterized protein n=1 Tax=Luedemannella helvata TaxID=349315 RepID=A0ABN2KY15_9ACTN